MLSFRRPRLFACALAAAMLLFGFGAPAAAQTRQLTVEASVIRGALGYAWRVSDRVLAGVELGFGFPQIDRTLSPEQNSTAEPDFEEYLHAALLARFAASGNFEVDAGVRAAIVDLWPCAVSDCWPERFVGAYAQPMVGWRRVKFGVRLTGGWVAETPAGSTGDWTGIVALNPFIVRLTFAW